MATRPTRLRIDPQDYRVRKCTSQKRGYATRERALTVADEMMREGHVLPGCHITPYACGECGQWHVANRQIVPVPGAPRRKHRRTDVEEEA